MSFWWWHLFKCCLWIITLLIVVFFLCWCWWHLTLHKEAVVTCWLICSLYPVFWELKFKLFVHVTVFYKVCQSFHDFFWTNVLLKDTSLVTLFPFQVHWYSAHVIKIAREGVHCWGNVIWHMHHISYNQLLSNCSLPTDRKRSNCHEWQQWWH